MEENALVRKPSPGWWTALPHDSAWMAVCVSELHGKSLSKRALVPAVKDEGNGQSPNLPPLLLSATMFIDCLENLNSGLEVRYSYTPVLKVHGTSNAPRSLDSFEVGDCRNYLWGKFFWMCSIGSAITGLKEFSRKRVVAFLLSGPVLIGEPYVLWELCGSECTGTLAREEDSGGAA